MSFQNQDIAFEQEKKHILRPYIYPTWVNHAGARRERMTIWYRAQYAQGFFLPTVGSLKTRDLRLTESFNREFITRGQRADMNDRRKA